MSHHLFERDFAHQRAVAATMDAAEPNAKASLNEMIAAARAANLPWAKIFSAIMTAAAGGFTPQAIAAAIAILFGSSPPPAMQALASAGS